MADVAAGIKAQVARDVCAASAAFASCTHHRGPRRRCSPRRPQAPFVDWYLVLAIGEAASEEAIRRRYRHLALQLHPDKNRHPKAEVAFKLVSEAHACLTDKARRRAFDAERATAFCAACHQDRSRSTSTAPSTTAATTTTSSRNRSKKASTASSPAQQPQAQHCPVPKPRCGVAGRMSAQALREVQNRLRDEWRVIDGCLRANNNARRQSFPLFDPSDHRRRIPDYPHARPSPLPQQNAGIPPPFERQDQSWCRGVGVGGGGGGGICESPVYQISTAPERAARTKRPW